MNKIKKPKKKSQSALDWNEVTDFIKEKYKKDVRDWDNMFGKKPKKDAVYQDFWHWICDTNEIHNGSYFYLSSSYLGDDEDYPDYNLEIWQKEILQIIFEEFGHHSDDDESIKFYVSW